MSKVCSMGINNPEYMWNYVEKYEKKFQEKKCKYADVKTIYEDMPSLVQTEFTRFLFHDIPNSIELFRRTFNIELFDDDDLKTTMIKYIDIRHDIVHRNGRKEIPSDGITDEYHQITKADVEKLISDTNKLVYDLDAKLLDAGIIS